MAVKGRAVLVICETGEQVKKVREALQHLQKDHKICLKFYTNEENSSVTNEKLQPGDIILATNIAGRGTDFQTSEALETNGGLHVCLGFLPYNQRVEDQAFGRTSRQGNKGTAQLVIPQSDLTDLTDMDIDTTDFAEIKRARNERERVRLQHIRDVRVKELKFKDDLFTIFISYYQERKFLSRHCARQFYLKDLVEGFAFWLHEMEQSPVKPTDAKKAFEGFKQRYLPIAAEGIGFNPFYYVEAAKLHNERSEPKQAMEMLQIMLRICGDNPALTYGAHTKLAEIIIASADALRANLIKALKKVIFLNVQSIDDYKHDAAFHVKEAKKSLETEIEYLKSLFGVDVDVASSSTVIAEEKSVSKIRDVHCKPCETTSEEAPTNYFLKHINARLAILRFHLEYVEKMFEDVNRLKAENHGVAIVGRIDSSEQKLYTNDINSDVFKTAIAEIRNVGLDTLLCLKEVGDIPNEKIRYARAHIGIAIVALGVGVSFGPATKCTNIIAITLIMDTVVDLIVELISKGVQNFNRTSFHVSKGITYLAAVLTMGLSLIPTVFELINRAMQFCTKAAGLLRRSKFLPQLCFKLATWLENFTFICKAVQRAIITTTQVVQTVQRISPAAVLTITGNVVKPMLSVVAARAYTEVFFEFKDNIGKRLMDLVRENPQLEKLLEKVSFGSLEKHVGEFLTMEEECKPIIKKLRITLPFEGKVLQMPPLSKSEEFLDFAKGLCGYLERHLSEENDCNQLERVIQQISSLVAQHLVALKITAISNSQKSLL